MGFNKPLLSGVVAFVVATLAVRAVGGKGTKIGLLAGGAVAVSTWLSGRGTDSEIELEDELVAE